MPPSPATITATVPASAAFLLGGDLPVHRLGLGTMRLTGPGHWGPPADPARAIRVLRAAVDLDINHIDTADAYGPRTSETLIRQALHPYPDHLVIATKGGMTRPGPHQWKRHGDPAYLRACVHSSLRRLGVDRIDLYYLHRIDPLYPLAEQLGVLTDLQRQGKIRHIGLSKVTTAQLAEAQQHATVTAAQNRHHWGLPADPVLAACEAAGIAYVPYTPLGAGQLPGTDPGLQQAACDLDATPAQYALAWLLYRSSVTLPIPGTRSVRHLLENCGAARLHLPVHEPAPPAADPFTG